MFLIMIFPFGPVSIIYKVNSWNISYPYLRFGSIQPSRLKYFETNAINRTLLSKDHSLGIPCGLIILLAWKVKFSDGKKFHTSSLRFRFTIRDSVSIVDTTFANRRHLNSIVGREKGFWSLLSVCK